MMGTVLLPLSLLPLSLSFILNIYHTNDVHARFNERGSVEGGKCKADQAVCYGGMPRHAKYLKDNVKSSANNLILSAGDWFTGTTYFSAYTGNLSAHYLDKLNYDAWALGNHEFDKGPELLARTVKQIKKTKTVCANMMVTGSSGLVVDKSTIKTFTRGDGSSTKVGIIGYITPDTSFLSSAGPDISFSDVVTAVREEAGKLTRQGVDIVIALGHAGIETDKAICEQVSDVDVVVGGHTNTFLWNGILPDDLKDYHTVEGPYPISLRHNKCLVVQAFAYGKFIGALEVNFTSAGEVEDYSGDPVLMSSAKYDQDSAALAELDKFSTKVEEYANIKVGYTNKEVDGTRQNCRSRECELGNVVADAFLESFRRNDKNVVCAFINSGGIRSGIAQGDITYDDLLTILPFGNTVDRISITGSVLKKAFEHSVSSFTANGFNVGEQGRYLQVSGIKVYYNLTRDVGSRVAKLTIQTPSGDKYVEVEDDKEYACAGLTYVFGGGDGYTMLKDLTKIDGEEDVDALRYFVGEHNPLDKYPALKGIPSRSFFSAAPSLTSTLFIDIIFLGLLFRS